MEAKTELPIVRRLRRRTPSRVDFLYGEEGNKLINPDGLEAADIIEALVEALHGLVERITEAWPELANLPPMETARAALTRAKED